jgi:tetratricopeptide (TPR) repeat protein
LSQLKKKFEVKSEIYDKNKNKSKDLLNFFLKAPEIHAIDLEKKIYGGSNKEAFHKLIERAIEKIEEVIISFTRDSMSNYLERNYYYFYLKRKLLVIQMMWLRGVHFDINKQLDRIISISKKFEFYDVTMDALHIKQRYLVLRSRTKVRQIQNLIDKYDEIRKKVQAARNIWVNLTDLIVHHASSSEYNHELIEKVQILSEYYKQTRSDTVGYFYFYSVVALNSAQGNYKETEVFLHKIQSLLFNNKAIYTKVRDGETLANLANIKILMGDYSSAISFALKSKELIQTSEINYCVAAEAEFIARFFNEEYQVAGKLINEIYTICKTDTESYMHSKYAYMYACFATSRGDIKKSNELLSEVKEIEKDKGGWNLGKRILTIINGIESKDCESVERKVLSLEKFMKRISKSIYVRKRDKLISRILLKLINENFDFNKVYIQRKEYFDLLEGNDPDYTWKITSPELIIFHEWFKNKMENNPKLKTKPVSIQ